MNLTSWSHSKRAHSGRSCLASFAVLFVVSLSATVSSALAVDPPPTGGYPNAVTALGDGALANGNPGANNTGLGFEALKSVTSAGIDNTAVGNGALENNTTGSANLGVGYQAGIGNTTGTFNTAVGYGALASNTTGSYNVAIGEEALVAHASGFDNVAVGPGAMVLGTEGEYNVAVGANAMAFSNGTDNVALGDGAMNTANGNFNVAIGQGAGLSFDGDNNIAIGQFAGKNVTGSGSNNIEIGHQGKKKDNAVIRIGTKQEQTFIAGISRTTISDGVAVMVNDKGQLGVMTSSARYKEAIRPMQEASDAILSLKPVTFRYKKELDPEAKPQFGLVAEQVAKVDPDLVVRDDNGKPYTVRYEAVNAMLLNEFLKEHQKVKALEVKLNALESLVNKQSAIINKVSANVEGTAPRLVSTED